ncbi:MAG: DMT family transporter [Pseudomonadota bacterium]
MNSILYRQSLMLGSLFIILSEIMFASMGAAVKAVSTDMPNEMIVFMRNLVGALVLLPLLWRYGWRHLQTRIWYLHVMRAGFGVAAMYCFYYALANMPLASGMLLKMTSPLFIPLVALVWLGEGITRRALLAVMIGFIGVILVLKPQSGFQAVALVGLLGGALASVAKVTVRRLGRSEPTTRIVFYFALVATLVSGVPLSWSWQTPDTDSWLLLLLIGIVGTLGQLLLTRGYSVARPSQVGAFTYTSVVFAALFGYLFWDEMVDYLFVIGALIIAGAGMLVLQERQNVSLNRARFDNEPL